MTHPHFFQKTATALFLSMGILAAYPNGSRIPGGNAGEPGTGTPCASCHTVTLNPTGGSVKLTLPGANIFTPGTTQRLSVAVTDPNTSWHSGFQLTATAGSFTAVSSTVVITSSGKQYVDHSSSASAYTFDWTPPSGVDTVTFYVAGIAASGTRRTNAYTTSVTLTRAQSTTRPTITSAGVLNSASFAQGISSGSWVTIFGTNLAPAGVSRSWTGSEIVDGKLPTELETTQVKINGKPAAIAFISPTQLNVQAPEDTATGTVSVEVTSAGATSDAVTADLRAAAPGFFRFSPSSSRYVAAVHADGTLAATSGLLGSGVASRAPKSGDVILLFGTGFGATTPAVPAGYVFSGAAPLAAGNNLTIRIGGVAAQVTFAGLSGAGLYQFNVTVPNLGDGDHLVEATAWGQSVPTQQYLAVKN